MSEQPLNPSSDDGSPEEPPPLLGTWRRLYAALLGLLAFYILVFWLITVAYR